MDIPERQELKFTAVNQRIDHHLSFDDSEWFYVIQMQGQIMFILYIYFWKEVKVSLDSENFSLKKPQDFKIGDVDA